MRVLRHLPLSPARLALAEKGLEFALADADAVRALPARDTAGGSA